MAGLGRVGAMDPVTVQQPGTGFGEIAVPDLVGLPAHVDAFGLPASPEVKEAEFDFFRMLRKDREIHLFTVPGGAEGIRFPRP